MLALQPLLHCHGLRLCAAPFTVPTCLCCQQQQAIILQQQQQKMSAQSATVPLDTAYRVLRYTTISAGAAPLPPQGLCPPDYIPGS